MLAKGGFLEIEHDNNNNCVLCALIFTSFMAKCAYVRYLWLISPMTIATGIRGGLAVLGLS